VTDLDVLWSGDLRIFQLKSKRALPRPYGEAVRMPGETEFWVPGERFALNFTDQISGSTWTGNLGW